MGIAIQTLSLGKWLLSKPVAVVGSSPRTQFSVLACQSGYRFSTVSRSASRNSHLPCPPNRLRFALFNKGQPRHKQTIHHQARNLSHVEITLSFCRSLCHGHRYFHFRRYARELACRGGPEQQPDADSTASTRRACTRWSSTRIAGHARLYPPRSSLCVPIRTCWRSGNRQADEARC